MKSLRERHSRLQKASGTIADTERALQEAISRRDTARRRVAESLTDEHIRELDRVGLSELAALARDLEQLEADKDAADALSAWVGSVEVPRIWSEFMRR